MRNNRSTGLVVETGPGELAVGCYITMTDFWCVWNVVTLIGGDSLLGL